jgi:PAS domain S-box-containing protein
MRWGFSFMEGVDSSQEGTSVRESRKTKKELLEEIEACRRQTRELERTVSELIAHQKALILSEERYRSLVETINEAVYETDENGIVSYVSPSGGGLRGYDPSDIVGRHFTEFVYQEDLTNLLKMYERIMTGPVPLSEYRLVLKSGELIWVQSSSRALFENDRFKGLRGTLTDISERKIIEEERRNFDERLARVERLEALGMLAGGVAHDLNNVLGGLIGYSELLFRELPEKHRSRKYASGILKSGQKAAAIIDDLLTLSRRGVPADDVFNLNDVITDYFKTPHFEGLQAHHSHVTFRRELGRGMWNTCGSPVHLEKTVMNLLSNAAEAIPMEGEVIIRTENRYLDRPVRGYDQIQQGNYVALAVSDNGTGISQADLKRIFEPFYTKKKMGRSGTGLGLAVVWGTVKDHGGYIDIHSEKGRGSSFSLYFPATSRPPAAKRPSLPENEIMGRGESILVVDDIQEQRILAATMLEKLGYRTCCVSSGEEALKLLKRDKVDLLVLDMIMDPGIDGLETYRRALSIHPGQKAVIVSGFAETDRVRKALELGAGSYVRKPYVLEKIGSAIRSELDRAALGGVRTEA